jgi:hypothetical protein
MLKITPCADPKCSCHDERPDPEAGAGIPVSRTLIAVDEWLAKVESVLADELPVAA